MEGCIENVKELIELTQANEMNWVREVDLVSSCTYKKYICTFMRQTFILTVCDDTFIVFFDEQEAVLAECNEQEDSDVLKLKELIEDQNER